jgi:tungstate transport system substrate-binding protein
MRVASFSSNQGAAIIRRMVQRRLLVISIGGMVCGTSVWSQQRRSLSDPLRLGVDTALSDSGLARGLQRGFGRDTGIVVQLVPSPALPMLEALERGEIDAALANVPEPEARLEQQGLAYDRHLVAAGSFVIVGPAPRGKIKDPAGLAGGRDAAAALVALRQAALATPGSVTFLSAGDGSGTHAAEQGLWREAKIAPTAPWYETESSATLVEKARQRGAYALVERGAWLAQPGSSLAVLVEDDPRMVEVVHVMRSFRVNHPAGKIFVGWISGPKGRRVVVSQRGYRAAGA